MKDAYKLKIIQILQQVLQNGYNEIEYWKGGDGYKKSIILDPDITNKVEFFNLFKISWLEFMML